MRKIIYAALATSFVFGLTECIAQKKNATTSKGSTSLWKVSKDGKSIFIGGTVHLLRKEDYPLPKPFMDAYDASDVLTFETDTKALSNPDLGMTVMEKGMYQDQTTLDSVLSQDVYEQLKAVSEKLGIPIGAFIKMKPGLVITTLSAMQLRKAGIGQDGVDIFFTNKAAEDKKEVQHLESVTSQIDHITTMGEGREDEFVKYSLKDMEGMTEQMGDLILSWKKGKAKPMEEEIASMKKDYPDTYKSLLVQRNMNWMPQILSYLENGTKAFVLVGALHLYGEDGLLNLLKKQDYQIEQL